MKFHRRLVPVAVALGVLALAAPRPALAQTTPALSFTGGNLVSNSSDFMIGWQFSLSGPVTVAALGFFDDAGNGLLTAHRVGIFDNGGALVVEATVPVGVAGTLVNGFRYSSALTGSPNLAAGTYVIGATYIGGSGEVAAVSVPAGNVTTAAGVTYLQERELGTSVFTAPTANVPGSERGIFGPNFLLTTSAAAPEPTSLALVALMGGVAGVFRGRRRGK